MARRQRACRQKDFRTRAFIGGCTNLETSAALTDEFERGVDVAKDLFMMSGNFCITMRVNRDHHRTVGCVRANRSVACAVPAR